MQELQKNKRKKVGTVPDQRRLLCRSFYAGVLNLRSFNLSVPLGRPPPPLCFQSHKYAEAWTEPQVKPRSN
jgi:hypothetical protein